MTMWCKSREDADALMDVFDAADVRASLTRERDRREGDVLYSVGILGFTSVRAFVAALDTVGIKDAEYSAGMGWSFHFEEPV